MGDVEPKAQLTLPPGTHQQQDPELGAGRMVLLQTQKETKLRKEGMLESLTAAGELPLSYRAMGTKVHLLLTWAQPHANANQTDGKPLSQHSLLSISSTNLSHAFTALPNGPKRVSTT